MRPYLLRTFISNPAEAHAVGYGFAIGYALNADDRAVRLGLLALVVLGESGADGDSRVNEELTSQRQYAIAACLLGILAAGLANRRGIHD